MTGRENGARADRLIKGKTARKRAKRPKTQAEVIIIRKARAISIRKIGSQNIFEHLLSPAIILNLLLIFTVPVLLSAGPTAGLNEKTETREKAVETRIPYSEILKPSCSASDDHPFKLATG